MTTEEIKAFIVEAKKAEKTFSLTKVTKASKYINKTNPDDSFTSLDEAFKKGLDLSKYELKTVKTGFKVDFEYIINDKDVFLYREFIKYIDLCNSTTNEGYDVKAEFKKLKTAIDNKVNALKADAEKQQIVKDFRTEVNAAKAVIDEISFKSLLEKYNEIKKNLK